jgi:ABC-type phosphate transport system substrate-binding protein
MKSSRIVGCAILLLTFLSPCFAHHMAVVVGKENNVAKVSSVQLARIFRSETKTWPDGTAIVLVVHKDSAAEMGTLEKLIKVNANQWKAIVAAHKDSIHLADSDADVLKIVQSTPGAIGLVDVRSIDSSVNVVSVDGKLPMESGYLPH